MNEQDSPVSAQPTTPPIHSGKDLTAPKTWRMESSEKLADGAHFPGRAQTPFFVMTMQRKNFPLLEAEEKRKRSYSRSPRATVQRRKLEEACYEGFFLKGFRDLVNQWFSLGIALKVVRGSGKYLLGLLRS